MENLGERSFYLVFFQEEENECVTGELIVMFEEVLFMETNVCKQKSMERTCVQQVIVMGFMK